ncbi:MAG: hypothetical protein CVU65_16950 [Deltaproteobacteria bacterium HGW-Deltaproteobacteria-22]|nr:MAG: hypothetical protein CVU65_16950 [Deltaproteobacteria bacterium HGW-Deltaproteobacteria-22]
MWLLLSWILSAPPTPAFRVEAQLPAPGKRLRGELVFPEFSGRRMDFWVYPNRLEKPPPGTSDISKFRIFPRRFDPGRLEIRDSDCDGQKLSLAWKAAAGVARARLIVTKDSDAPCRLRLRFQVKLPERYGPMGCLDDRCVLGAPWYPIPVQPGAASHTPLWRHSVRVKGHKREPFFLQGVQTGVAEAVGVMPFFPVVFGPGYQLTCRPPVCLYHFTPTHSMSDFLTGNRTGEMLQLAQEYVSTHFPENRQTIVLIESQLREELAMALPGRQMLVAHQAMRISSLPYFQSFHEQKLRLTLTETLFLDRMMSFERTDDLAFVPLLAAHAFLSRPKNVDGLLRPLEWIPQIDVMRKNPRMEFQDAYLPGPHNADRFRDDFRRWNNTKPRGEEVFHRLVDQFGSLETRTILERHRELRLPFRRLLDRHSGHSMEWFFERWVDNPQRVNLSIGRVHLVDREGGKWTYEIEIHQDPPLRTTLDLELTTSNGSVTRMRLDLSDKVHTVRAELNSPLVRAQLDPDERHQEPPGKGHLYPQADNIWPDPGWRFIFSGFEALFNVTELWSRLLVDVDFLPRHSLRRRLNILVSRTEYVDAGIAFGHLFYFGPRVSNTRLIYRWDTGAEVARTRPIEDPDTLEESRAITTSAFSRLVINDREDHMFPTHGGWGILEGRFTWFFPESDAFRESQLFRLTGIYTRYFGLPWGLSAAAQVNAGFLWGRVHHDSEMLHLTGPGMVQGYASGRYPGRTYGLGALELRHILLPRLDLTLGGLVYVTRLSAALYAGGGVVSGTRDGQWSEDPRAAASAGLALRIHGLWFGLYEAVLNLQVGVPLIRDQTGLDPFIFFISLEPTL